MKAAGRLGVVCILALGQWGCGGGGGGSTAPGDGEESTDTDAGPDGPAVSGPAPTPGDGALIERLATSTEASAWGCTGISSAGLLVGFDLVFDRTDDSPPAGSTTLRGLFGDVDAPAMIGLSEPGESASFTLAPLDGDRLLFDYADVSVQDEWGAVVIDPTAPSLEATSTLWNRISCDGVSTTEP